MFDRATSRCSYLLILVLVPSLLSAPKKVSFSQPAESVEAFDFVEVTVDVEGPDAGNPFTDATLRGSFGKTGGNPADDCGRLLRLGGWQRVSHPLHALVTGRLHLLDRLPAGRLREDSHRHVPSHRRPPARAVRVDPKYPWHFIWEGTGEHYFFNGTTAFWLVVGAKSESSTISIERLHRAQDQPDARAARRAQRTFLGRTGHDGRQLHDFPAALGRQGARRASITRASTSRASTSLTGRSGSACCGSPGSAT